MRYLPPDFDMDENDDPRPVVEGPDWFKEKPVDPVAKIQVSMTSKELPYDPLFEEAYWKAVQEPLMIRTMEESFKRTGRY